MRWRAWQLVEPGAYPRGSRAARGQNGPRPEFPGEVRLRGWKDAGLGKPSVARCSKTLVVPTEAFAGQMRYGHLNEEDALAVAEALREVGATL